jgi:hypothetical protein
VIEEEGEKVEEIKREGAQDDVDRNVLRADK